MKFEVESTGKSIEKAIENALFELKAIREDVDIKIIDQGGLFKKAKVLVSISEDALEKYKKRESKREEIKEEEKACEEAVKEEICACECESECCEKDCNCECEPECNCGEECKCENCECEKSVENKLNAEDFIKGFVNVSGCGKTVEASAENNEIKIEIVGEKATDLIGYRGESLHALQYIANVIENEKSGEKKRVLLNIENYRQKREQTLKDLAKRMSAKVLKTGKFVKLEPMNASDRRIIHLELQDSDKLTTISKGVEPNRYLIILPKTDNE